MDMCHSTVGEDRSTLHRMDDLMDLDDDPVIVAGERQRRDLRRNGQPLPVPVLPYSRSTLDGTSVHGVRPRTSSQRPLRADSMSRSLKAALIHAHPSRLLIPCPCPGQRQFEFMLLLARNRGQRYRARVESDRNGHVALPGPPGDQRNEQPQGSPARHGRRQKTRYPYPRTLGSSPQGTPAREFGGPGPHDQPLRRKLR